MTNRSKIVMITDGGRETNAAVKEILESHGVQVMQIPKDGRILLDKILTVKPDVAVMDLKLPRIEAVDVVREVRKRQNGLDYDPALLILSAYDQDDVQKNLIDVGATDFYLKPIDTETLCGRILSYMEEGISNTSSDSELSRYDLEVLATEYIQKFGIPAHIKGYRYLREAIVLSVRNRELLDSVTKELYPSVAKQFGTTAPRVERAIRHAIEVAWDRGDAERLDANFGYSISKMRGKPTNSELIAAIADKIRLQNRGGRSVSL